MFARIFTLFTFLFFFFPSFATAVSVSRDNVNQCNVGAVQCCNSVQSASNPFLASFANIFGINLGAPSTQVGITCTNAGVLGIGGNSCSANPVCCTGNSFSGLIVIGCSPININLNL